MCIFPAELMCEILCYTSIFDVVRWRTVSRWFYAITYDHTVLRALYENASFIRPPGPFQNDSCQRAFMQSARLTRSWTAQPLRRVSYTKIPFDGYCCSSMLIAGRWFIACQTNRRLVLYDTNTNVAEAHVPQVLWEQKRHIREWDQYCGMPEEGCLVVYLVVTAKDPQWPRQLLEFRLDADSGALCSTTSFDYPIPPPDFNLWPGSTMGWSCGTPVPSRFIFIPAQSSLVFDQRTRAFYRLPEYHLARDHTNPRVTSYNSVRFVVTTTTHVIVLHRFEQWKSFVAQAFTVPEDQCAVESGNNTLRLSHEGIFETRDSASSCVLVRNSIIDPATERINVRLVLFGYCNFGFGACLELTLQEPSTTKVSPITIEQHPVRVMAKTSLRQSWQSDSLYLYRHCDVSDNSGYARGLYIIPNHAGAKYGHNIVKFTIDATGDQCVARLSEITPVKWLEFSSLLEGTLDSVRGKFCFPEMSGYGGHAIGVIDLE